MDWLVDVGKIVGPAVLSFFAGRATKNREFMSTDLEARTKELRELIGQIAASAVSYWSRGEDDTAAAIAEDIVLSLHKMQRLRVYCGMAGAGYKSGYIRKLESDFFEIVSGDDFMSKKRQADSGSRIRRIRNIAADLEFAALEARRADLFLIPYEKIRQWYNHRLGRH